MVRPLSIVLNSSPLIFLVKLDFLDLFLETDDRFYVPNSVIAEIQGKTDGIDLAIDPSIKRGKIQTRSTNLLSFFNRINQNLGMGESEAIALALEIQADYIILDDLAARKIALNLGLNVKGTLAIIKKLTQKGQITVMDKNEFYERLIAINFKVSRSVFDSIFADE